MLFCDLDHFYSNLGSSEISDSLGRFPTMTIKNYLGFILALLLAFSMAGCKSYRLIYQSDGIYDDSEYLYENLSDGDKIKLRTKDQIYQYKYFVMGLKDDTLRVEGKDGLIRSIPLTNVHYIMQSQSDTALSLVIAGIVIGLTAIIIHASREW